MKSILGIFFAFVFTASALGQVTFIVNQLPDNHNYNDSIYISGDFENWSGGKEAYRLKKEDKLYSITLPGKENFLYKFTLGSWQTVELDGEGTQTDNRVYKFKKEQDTIFVKIASWQGSVVTNKSTAAKNVTVVPESFKIQQLNRERRVLIYLPPGYEDSEERYPVLYMHDGQNLFDKKTSYSGEWQVDETLNSLFRKHNFKVIVIGIDNGGEKRLDEYSPWINKKYGGGEGAAYLEFIVKTLKPSIDKNYRTLIDRENTGILGSSMGGLISHYAALKYPEVFGKAGVYSPAFWFAPQVNDFSKKHGKLDETQLFFLAGGKEGANVAFNEISQTVKDMNSMVALLKEQGFPATNLKTKVIPEGKHNEELWRTNFEETILWLFPKAKKPTRTFVSASQEADNQLKVTVSDGTYRIKFYSDKIVETTFVPKGESFNKESHAVVLKPAKLTAKIEDTEDAIRFSSNGIATIIQKEPFKISYHYKGKEITSEKNGYRNIEGLETLQFNLSEDEVLYGGGARALGMNRRGNRLRLYNRAHYGYEEHSELMNYTMPLVLSSKQYMIHFDNAPIGFLDLDSHQENTLTYETISGRKTYHVIVGDSWYDLVDTYTDLTGKQPLPPRWALGNFASRFGYRSQKEAENVVKAFKEEEIPLDAIILDIYWFGKDIKGHMGNLEWYKDSFPEPKKMMRDFTSQNIKTVLVSEPFILSTSKRWDEAISKGVLAKDSIGNPAQYEFYFGNTGIVDIYKPEAKEWFWDIYKELADQGVAGIWGDLGEPEVHPQWVQHATGTADEVHNTYGHDWAKLVYEGYQKDFPDKRLFILMRAGYSGSQRFGLIPWSGDVNRSWGGLKSQPEIALQMGMQGLAYMHSDLGGFAGANLDDELYARWLQYGVFQPIYRPHAQEEVPAEPVFRSDSAKALAKQAIDLRYKLLPYNYNMLFENNQKGMPLMRPLFFEEPENVNLNDYSGAYLWGNDILVAPVLEAQKKQQNVYFPRGTWFDFYTGEKISGGQTKTIELKETSIPTYIRAGAFIPMANGLQNTKAYNGSQLTVHYYFDSSMKEESERSFYNDDGKTPQAFIKGMYELLEFEAELEENILEIELEVEIGKNYTFKEKQITLVIHNIDQKPKRIKLGKKKMKSIYKAQNKTLTIPIQWKSPQEIELNITLN